MFTPRKLDPVALGGPGRLWGYLQGGHQYADYYLARDGAATEAAVELHGKLFPAWASTSLTGGRSSGWRPAATR